MPPSLNKLYQRRQGGGVALKKAGYEFHRLVNQVVADGMAQLQGFPIDVETVYGLDIVLYFRALENAGWFVLKDGVRQAKTRYKRIDVDNRVKFLQDCITKAIGMPDDAQVFAGTQQKKLGKEEHVTVKITVRDRKEFIEEEANGGTEPQ